MTTKMVKCPTCEKETMFAPENQFRPFCSERCRLIDLGEWAQESYKVASKRPAHSEHDGEDSDWDGVDDGFLH